jgi:hypothetical protein
LYLLNVFCYQRSSRALYDTKSWTESWQRKRPGLDRSADRQAADLVYRDTLIHPTLRYQFYIRYTIFLQTWFGISVYTIFLQ